MTDAWPTEYYALVLEVLLRDDEVASIGQFSPAQKRLLDRAVKKGDLSKSRHAGPFPTPKTCYAAPEYDFRRSRQAHIDEMKRQAQVGPGRRLLSTAARN